MAGKNILPMLLTFAVCLMTGFAATCVTRMDCNATDAEGYGVCHDSRFTIELDTYGDIGFGGQGTCTLCANLSVDECYAPCYVPGGAGFCAPDPLIFVLNLDHQVPLVLGAMLGITKLVFSQVFLTQTKVGAPTSNLTTFLRAASICFMLFGMKNDVQKAWVALTSSMSWWLAFESVGLIWQSSSNMPAAAAIFAQIVFVKSTKIHLVCKSLRVFEETRAPILGALFDCFHLRQEESLLEKDDSDQKQSPMETHDKDDLGKRLLVWYARTLTFVYAVPGMLRVVGTVPTMIAYIWFFLPLLLLCRVVAVPLTPIVSKLTLGMIGFSDEKKSKFETELTGSMDTIIKDYEKNGFLGVCQDRLTKLGQDMRRFDLAAVLIGHQHWHKDGTLETAVVAVFLPTIISIAVTMQARWFDNYGYWEAFYLTMKERQLATFLNLSRSSATQLLDLIWRI
jgi:hypothetical protein